jgi:glycosyltransferase involved in cell wall biosynthesis
VRVVLDVQALQSAAHATRGIGRYVVGSTSALLDAGVPIEALLCNASLAPVSDAAGDGLAGSPLLSWNTADRVRRAAGAGPLVYHVCSPFETEGPLDGVVPRHALDVAAVVAVTLYDAIPFRFPERYQATTALRRFFARRAAFVRRADLVLTISEHTAADAVEVLGVDPARVHVAGSGASTFLTPPDARDAAVHTPPRAVRGLRRPFVLTVSGFEPRKDPQTLIRAFAGLPPDLRRAHQLVIACELPPGAEDEWRRCATDVGLTADDVVLTGRVSDELLRDLYQSARLFAFTSRAEGFGLPVLEAACCGCPAVTSDAFSLPEVLDEPASIFPAGDARALSALLARGLTDDGLRDLLSGAASRAARRHTWSAVAQRTMDGYEAAMARAARRAPPRATRRVPRPRIALVGPFPPTKSGVGVYGARVVDALSGMTDVDCFVEGRTPPEAPAASDSVRRFPIGALGRTFGPASYDAIVYALGNSLYHRRVLGLSLRFPGIVWLHDASLAGLYLTAAGLFLPDRPPPPAAVARERMRRAVERCTGCAAVDLGDDWWLPEAYETAGLSMTEEVLRTARAAIVTTNAAAETARAAAPQGLPITVLPLAVPHLAADPDADDGGDPWIVSPGWVDPVKRPDDLVRVVAGLRVSGLRTRLALVGEASVDQRAALEALAADLGCADAVRVTGFVDDDTYRRWIARAACVTVLRRRSHGEGSAAITDALALGRPVVTNLRTAAELPGGVVDLVDADAGVDALAGAIRRVVSDDAHRAALADAAAAYAASWGFEDVARALLDVVRATPAPRYPRPLVLADL